jgi:hypothetical protein
MMRYGECWELMMPALLTEEKGSGSWDGDATWQTPTAQDANGRTHHNQRDGSKRASLLGQVVWPTPTKSDGEGGPGVSEKRKGGLNLRTAVRESFPTPTVQDASNNGGPAQMQRNAPPLNAVAGGALNPTWVEWLMGWPLGWTDCGASGTDRFRLWCVLHGGRSRGCGEMTGVTSMTGVTISEHAEA